MKRYGDAKEAREWCTCAISSQSQRHCRTYSPGAKCFGTLIESTISKFGARIYGPFLLPALECPEHRHEPYDAFFQVFGSASALHSSDSSQIGSKLGPSRDHNVGLRGRGFLRHCEPGGKVPTETVVALNGSCVFVLPSQRRIPGPTNSRGVFAN